MEDYLRLKEMNLNQEENYLIQYIVKSDFIRNIIKKEVQFEEWKFNDFIEISSEVLEYQNL